MKLIKLKTIDALKNLNEFEKRIKLQDSIGHNLNKSFYKQNLLENLNDLNYEVIKARSDLRFNALMKLTSLCITASFVLLDIKSILIENYAAMLVGTAGTLVCIGLLKLANDSCKIDDPTLSIGKLEKKIEHIEKLNEKRKDRSL